MRRLHKLAAELARLEGKKSQAKIHDVVETLSLIVRVSALVDRVSWDVDEEERAFQLFPKEMAFFEKLGDPFLELQSIIEEFDTEKMLKAKERELKKEKKNVVE